MEEQRRIHLDPRSLLALAHPTRARLLGELRRKGPATSTTLASALGTNTGNTSYHLRKLAEAGLVEEVEDEGDKRDRWWRSAHEVTSWSEVEFLDDPETAAASDWLTGYQLRVNTRQAEDWLAMRREWPRAWIEASSFNDFLIDLDPEGLTHLVDELAEVIERHRRRPAGPGEARRVIVQLFAFPDARESG